MCCTLALLDVHTPSSAVENLLKGTSSAPVLGLAGWVKSPLLEGEASSPSQGVAGGSGAMVCYGEAHQVNVAVGPSQLHCPSSRFLWVLGVYCLGASSSSNMWLRLIIGVHGPWWDGPGVHRGVPPPSTLLVLCVWLGRLQGKSAWWGSGLSGVFGAGLGCTGSRVRRLCSYPIVAQTLSWLIFCRPPVSGVCLQCESSMLQQKETEEVRNRMTNTSFVLC